MNQNISPEERLFNVIQKTKNDPFPKGEADKKITLVERLRRLIKILLPPDKKEPSAAFSASIFFKLSEFDPRAVNAVSGVILALLTASVLYYAVSSRATIGKMIAAASKINFSYEKAQGGAEPFKLLNFYVDAITKRDIFQPGSVSAKGAGFSPPVTQLAETAKDLKLVGIAWGAVPKAMIQSEKENKMYILTWGQEIGTTGIKIKEIRRDKVVIIYGGAEMEL